MGENKETLTKIIGQIKSIECAGQFSMVKGGGGDERNLKRRERQGEDPLMRQEKASTRMMQSKRCKEGQME